MSITQTEILCHHSGALLYQYAQAPGILTCDNHVNMATPPRTHSTSASQTSPPIHAGVEVFSHGPPSPCDAVA